MRRFTYTGDCAAGFVRFTMEDGGPVITMPKDQPVEVPDKLAAKLQFNNHFVEYKAAETQFAKSRGKQKVVREPAAARQPGRPKQMPAKQATSRERRALIAQRLRKTPEISDRKIAKALGVSHPTVRAVRAKLEATGELEKSVSRIGADGKKRVVKSNTRIFIGS